MKKIGLILAAVALALFPMTAMACGDSCFPLGGSAEAQAFQNLSIEYSQEAGTQKIDATTTTFKTVDSTALNASGYGSLHTNPDVLFFGKIGVELVETDTFSVTKQTVCANLNTMSGSAAMAGDAGASAASTWGASASSAAGNSGGLTQVQTLHYAQGGGGFQAMQMNGYTTVNANAY